MLPSNDSSSPHFRLHSLETQNAYQELVHHLNQFAGDGALTERLNIDQMFILVDGVLPIEACLYYQVLPLFLDGNRLHLGMVNPEDTTASDYVRRIVSYLNYSLVTRRISSQALQAALSAYLKYSDSQSPAKSQQSSTSAVTHDNDIHVSSLNIPHNLETNSRETFVLDSTENIDPSELEAFTQEAGVVSSESEIGEIGEIGEMGIDHPPLLPAEELMHIDSEETAIIRFEDADDELQAELLPPVDVVTPDDGSANSAANGGVTSTDSTASSAEGSDASIASIASIVGEPTPSSPVSSSPAPSTSHDSHKKSPSISSGTLPPESAPRPSSSSKGDRPLRSDSVQLPSVPSSSEPGSGGPDKTTTSDSEAPASPLSVQVQSPPIDTLRDDLTSLAPRELLKVLLVRSMSGGIGRLYFERKSDQGRILWSQSGTLKKTVSNLDGATFQSLIDELKTLTRLPLLPLKKTKQVELERFYKGNRVLLRFGFIPGQYGEQATLQVLRGAALTFYQQQQVARVGKDAVITAQRLQSKMSELKARLEIDPRLANQEQTSLPELKQMLRRLQQQVEALGDIMNEPKNTPHN